MVAGAEEIAALIRTGWPEHPPASGFRLDDATAADGAIEVAFHWRLDPQPYLIRFPHPAFVTLPLGPRFSAEQAVGELALWLMEELDTGFVGRADRTRVGDAVLLEPGPDRFDGWFVGDVPLTFSPATSRRAAELGATIGEPVVVLPAVDRVRVPIAEPGGFLADLGLHVEDARRAVDDGSLIAWLQVGRGGLRDRAVGHAVVVRAGREAARIRVEVHDPAAFEPLASAACRRAVEDGAVHLTAAADETGLTAFGFREADGRLVARHDEIPPRSE